MNIAWPIMAGIVSGILTSALIYFFKVKVVPWHERIVYQGFDVSGEWRIATQYKSNFQVQDVTLNLSQRAHRLEGSAIYITKSDDHTEISEYIKTFKVEGKISDRFVVLTMRHAGRSRIGIETLLLEIKGDGRKMAGYTTFYDVAESNIISRECTLWRPETGGHLVAAQADVPITTQHNNSLQRTRRTAWPSSGVDCAARR